MPFFVSWRKIEERVDLQMEANWQKFREEQLTGYDLTAWQQAEFCKEMDEYRNYINNYMAQGYEEMFAQMKGQLLQELNQSMMYSQQAAGERIKTAYEQKIAALEKKSAEQESQLQEMRSYIKRLEQQIMFLRQSQRESAVSRQSVQPLRTAQPQRESAITQRTAQSQRESAVTQRTVQSQWTAQPSQRTAQPQFSDSTAPMASNFGQQPEPSLELSGAAHPPAFVLFQEEEEKNQRSIRQILFQCSLLRKEWEERYGSAAELEVYFKIIDKCSKKFSDLAAKMQNKEYDSEQLAVETVKILKQTVVKALAKEEIRPDVEHFLEKCMLQKVKLVPGQELSDEDYEYVDEMVFYKDVHDKNQHNRIIEVIQDAFTVRYVQDGDEYEAVIPGIYRLGRYKQL